MASCVVAAELDCPNFIRRQQIGQKRRAGDGGCCGWRGGGRKKPMKSLVEIFSVYQCILFFDPVLLHVRVLLFRFPSSAITGVFWSRAQSLPPTIINPISSSKSLWSLKKVISSLLSPRSTSSLSRTPFRWLGVTFTPTSFVATTKSTAQELVVRCRLELLGITVTVHGWE